jgi:superfamily I DNA/RNA helicase
LGDGSGRERPGLGNCRQLYSISDLATRTPEEIDEGRRLLYVAMTRAKDELDLVAPGFGRQNRC